MDEDDLKTLLEPYEQHIRRLSANVFNLRVKIKSLEEALKNLEDPHKDKHPMNLKPKDLPDGH